MPRSDFRGFNMLEEPPPRWPDWLEKWYRAALPEPVTSAMFDKILRDLWQSQKQLNESLFQRNQFLVPLKQGYRTPDDIQFRVRERQLERERRER